MQNFSHTLNTDTAGGQFTYALNNALARNKGLKDLQKKARRDPQRGTADQIAAYYLATVDEALKRLRAWLAKHPDRAWQMKPVMPNQDGFWSIGGLQPGGYEIVVRGRFSGYDAGWEASVDLDAGKTVSLRLTEPRFFRFRHE